MNPKHEIRTIEALTVALSRHYGQEVTTEDVLKVYAMVYAERLTLSPIHLVASMVLNGIPRVDETQVVAWLNDLHDDGVVDGETPFDRIIEHANDVFGNG